MSFDRPIHLSPSDKSHTEASVTCPVWLTQSNLDGLQALIQFISGLERGQRVGLVPGGHELIMHYRQLRDAISQHKEPQD